jgi:hypothetical protein
MDVVEGGYENSYPRASDRHALGTRREFVVATRKAGRGEAQVELAVTGREVPDGGGEEAAWGEVVGWERHPGGCVGRIGYEPAVEFVERISETAQVGSSRSGVTSMSRVS